mmetsp:Transcript_18656/g.42417  ORF Transcript_18656/g.42417 Transcript_18656/m.42417 type:complete len:311 (+) Transcript_18656:618-1550(+)
MQSGCLGDKKTISTLIENTKQNSSHKSRQSTKSYSFEASLVHHIRFAFLVATEGCPLNLGESEAMRNFTKGLTGDGYVPPMYAFTKKLLFLIFDMTASKLHQLVKMSAGMYKNAVRWVFLTADTWTCRKSRGFLAIEVSFLVLDELGNFKVTTFCVGCIYVPGSHSAKALAAIIRRMLLKFGIDVFMIRIYVSDSGGGIPAVAKILDIPRGACQLHWTDLARGHGFAVKGNPDKHREGAKLAREVIDGSRAVVNHFKNATQKKEVLWKAFMISSTAFGILPWCLRRPMPTKAPSESSPSTARLECTPRKP